MTHLRSYQTNQFGLATPTRYLTGDSWTAEMEGGRIGYEVSSVAVTETQNYRGRNMLEAYLLSHNHLS